MRSKAGSFAYYTAVAFPHRDCDSAGIIAIAQRDIGCDDSLHNPPPVLTEPGRPPFIDIAASNKSMFCSCRYDLRMDRLYRQTIFLKGLLRSPQSSPPESLAFSRLARNVTPKKKNSPRKKVIAHPKGQ